MNAFILKKTSAKSSFLQFRMLQKSYAHSQQMGYTLANSTLGKPALFPSSFAEGIHYGDTVTTSGPSHHAAGAGYHHHRGHHHQHDVSCPRFAGRRTNIREGSRSIGGMETSITSLHSSGHDSGIVDTGGMHCQCGQSSSQSSGEDSSNSYEDSLKSVHHKRHGNTNKHESKSPRHRERRRSFSDEFLHGTAFAHRTLPPHGHMPHSAATLLMPGSRRSNERLMMSCPMNP